MDWYSCSLLLSAHTTALPFITSHYYLPCSPIDSFILPLLPIQFPYFKSPSTATRSICFSYAQFFIPASPIAAPSLTYYSPIPYSASQSCVATWLSSASAPKQSHSWRSSPRSPSTPWPSSASKFCYGFVRSRGRWMPHWRSWCSTRDSWSWSTGGRWASSAWSRVPSRRRWLCFVFRAGSPPWPRWVSLWWSQKIYSFI